MSYYEQLLEKKGITLKPEAASARRQIVTMTMHMPKVDVDVKSVRSAFDPVTGQRICCVCLVAKPPDQYTVNRQKVDGRDARCKPCKSRLITSYQNAKRKRDN